MIKKEKIFELKIQEDDEVSGIDSISLVDEPAIEVNWMFFKKEKEHEFHIPDGEDSIYLEKLMGLSQDEQELFNEGWVVDNIKVLGEQGFYSTNPNGPSIEDEKEYNVRYKYILKPGIAENSVIKTTRDFCRTLVSQNRVWRVEDMEATRNDFGDSALVWRGGYNCRHVWARIEYKKDATIINKASVNKGKVDVGGFPSGLAPDTRVLGYDQPSTVTSKTLGNPSPSTIKNLGLSKEGFADKPKVSIDYDGTLSTDKGKELYKELIDGGNDVYIVTARNEKEGQPILALAKELRIPQDKVLFTDGGPKSEVLKRIGITKHYDNNPDVVAEINKNAPDVEAIKFGYDVGGLPAYVDQLPKKKKRFEEEFDYLFPKQDMSKQHFATDNEKHIVLGPAMIPDQKIFRKDNDGNPYYVYFSPETIRLIAEKYMRNKYTDNNDTMHDGKAIKDIHVMESWIKEDSQDKSNKYGFENLPIGTWFVSMKVNNPNIWEEVKQGKLNGFSVSGYFEEVAQFTREEMFLYKVAEVLKNIKD
jgi:hypothetical protein